MEAPKLVVSVASMINFSLLSTVRVSSQLPFRIATHRSVRAIGGVSVLNCSLALHNALLVVSLACSITIRSVCAMPIMPRWRLRFVQPTCLPFIFSLCVISKAAKITIGWRTPLGAPVTNKTMAFTCATVPFVVAIPLAPPHCGRTAWQMLARCPFPCCLAPHSLAPIPMV